VIRALASRTVYENAWLRLREDEVEFPDGRRGIYGVVEKEDFALVVPWDGARLTLVGQFRHPIGAFTWEFPQGSVDGAAPEDAARQELEEETGLRAAALRHLGHAYGAYGFCSQGFHVWLATDLVQGEPRREPTEQGMEVRAVTPAELDALVLSGEIHDACSVAAWALVRLGDGLP
jgi:8-oxo-dGTP pyrophosphatase MutT (NUDIX family)